MSEEDNVVEVRRRIKEEKYDELAKELKTKDKKRKLHAIEELVQFGDEKAAEPLTD